VVAFHFLKRYLIKSIYSIFLCVNKEGRKGHCVCVCVSEFLFTVSMCLRGVRWDSLEVTGWREITAEKVLGEYHFHWLIVISSHFYWIEKLFVHSTRWFSKIASNLLIVFLIARQVIREPRYWFKITYRRKYMYVKEMIIFQVVCVINGISFYVSCEASKMPSTV